MQLKSVCLIASGIDGRNWRLQPWRYLTEVACRLSALGHPVTVVSNARESVSVEMLKCQVKVRRVSSVANPLWKSNHKLLDEIHQAEPEVIIWHLGLTSFLYQAIPVEFTIPIIGLFSSPIHRPQEFAHLGLKNLLRNHRLVRVNLVGSLIPKQLLRILVLRQNIHSLVVQTQTTKKMLEKAGIWPKPIQVILPGVDERWLNFDSQNFAAIRNSWGFNQQDLVLLYYGSLSDIRGLPTLLQAFMIALRGLPNLKLVILSRRTGNQWIREHLALIRWLQDHHLEPHVKIIDGFLEPDVLVSNVAAADIITLPFALLPSDAPLSIIESLALDKPVITTRVACLPELVSGGKGYLAEPSNPLSLSEVIKQAAAEYLIDHGSVLPNPEKNLHRSWQEMGAEWSRYLQSL